MKIYTKTGDHGDTSLIGGRVRKDNARVEAYGTIDELNAFVGQTIAGLEGDTFADLREALLIVQHELFDCGADLAVLGSPLRGYKVTATMIERVESWIDRYEEENDPITKFILPGGTIGSSQLHICRTVCRRAERRVVKLSTVEKIHEAVPTYLNRLSDLFFTLARVVNKRSGIVDVAYERSADVFKS
jgi:cob(I)alamin adenosyltransferase